jgi:hypothetical protein
MDCKEIEIYLAYPCLQILVKVSDQQSMKCESQRGSSLLAKRV